MLLFMFLLSCDNDDYPYADVPSVVLNEFWAQYPNAREAEFDKSGRNYEVEFEMKQTDFKALIDPSGRILKEKREIQWEALPAEVQSALKREFGKEKIKDIEVVKAGNETYYQAEVNRLFMNENVVIRKTGEKDPALNYWE